MGTFTSQKIDMDLKERLDLKARDLGISWKNINSKTDWNDSALDGVKFGLISEEWRKKAIPTFEQQFRKKKPFVRSAQMTELFEEWFNAPEGTQPRKHPDFVEETPPSAAI